MVHDSPGFWGAPTSSVDWCETNYAFTPYVAELWNTLSSLAIVVAGALGLLLHRRVLERRFLLAFALVSLVGIGSIAFHATLRFELQMLDEIPMLYSAMVMLYILLENGARPRLGGVLPFALAAWALVITLLSALTRGDVQFYAFQLSFGSLEFFALYRSYRIFRARKDLPPVRFLFRAGMTFYGVAILLWFIDLRLCAVMTALPERGIPNPELHAWWHVLVSGGLYLLVLLFAFDRGLRLGKAPTLQWALGGMPHLRFD